MKKKVVLKVNLHCHKCRKKALKAVSEVDGVICVAIEGEERDRMVVIGCFLDIVKLTESVRDANKVGNVEVMRVEEVKPPAPPASTAPAASQPATKETPSQEPPHFTGTFTHSHHGYPPAFVLCEVDEDPKCSIM